jgi:pilus assembly protein CpaB
VDVDPEYQTILPNYTASVTKVLFEGDNPTESYSVDVWSDGHGTEQGRTELDPTINQPVYIQPSEPQRPRLVCQNVIQDAIIIRVGDFPLSGVEPTPIQEPTEVADQATEQEPPAPEPVPLSQIVTIAVSPQDAVVLTYMKKASIEITFALLNPNNDQITLTDAVTQQYLMDQKNIPLPAKLPFALEPFEGQSAPIE